MEDILNQPFIYVSNLHLLKFNIFLEVLVCVLVTQSCPTLCDPTCQGPLCMGFSRQEYWSWLPFPLPGNRPHPGIKSQSPALQADSLPSALTGTSTT